MAAGGGGVCCGGLQVVEMCACGAEECLAGERPAGDPPPCETLSHVFLHCPVVKPAVEWLRGLVWARLGNGPPVSVSVFLATAVVNLV